MEVFKDIAEFTGLYQVSDHGNVKSLIGEDKIILKPSINPGGYYNVVLKGRKTRRIHRLVALAFIPNPNNLPEVNHKDGIKTNNKLNNLEWTTSSKNQKHSYRLGLSKPLPRSQLATLASKPVSQHDLNGKEIDNFISSIDASRKTGVSHYGISKVCIGKLKTSGGYKWKFTPNEQPITSEEIQ